MTGTYNVLLGDQVIGKVCVTKQGLYYLFDSQCRLSGEVIYQLVVTCGDRQETLGIFVPRDGCFGMKARLPVKRLGEEELVFHAKPRHAEVTGNFVPICSEEPFAYLTKLEGAFLAARDGQVGIVLRE